VTVGETAMLNSVKPGNILTSEDILADDKPILNILR